MFSSLESSFCQWFQCLALQALLGLQWLAMFASLITTVAWHIHDWDFFHINTPLWTAVYIIGDESLLERMLFALTCIFCCIIAYHMGFYAWSLYCFTLEFMWSICHLSDLYFFPFQVGVLICILLSEGYFPLEFTCCLDQCSPSAAAQCLQQILIHLGPCAQQWWLWGPLMRVQLCR